LRCVKAEQLLKGQQAGAGAFDEAAAQAVAESSPIDDSRATAWYRQKAAKPVVARALAQAAGA
jgi:CO/xanthine dehydrogenase FAD-binding subunit